MSQVIKRRQLLVDRKLQGSLVVRVIAYWAACIATLELLSIGLSIASGPEQDTFWDYFASQDWRGVVIRIVVSGCLLMPILYDMLRLSHRIAGPVYRMRRVLRRVAETGKPQYVQLRQGDYLHAFAGELNLAMGRLTGEAEDSKAQALPEIPRLDEPLALLR